MGKRLIAMLLLLAATTPAVAGTKAGVAAWQRGDYKRAVAEWRAPAIAGDAAAQFNLGQAYKLGRGVPLDLATAEGWYRKAALQGYPPAEDNYALTLFQSGRAAQALPWLEKSAARGEARALYVLGMIHFNADIVPQDRVRAYALMTRAQAAGLPQATQALAQMDGLMPLAERQKGIAMARDLVITPSRPAPQPKPAPRPTTPTTTATAPNSGEWRVQLGTFRNPDGARRLWSQLTPRFPGRQPSYPMTGDLTRLLVGPYATKADAARACEMAEPCVPVR
ncbi:SPOR domain-containing protein [Sphingomonas sp. RS2018]